LKVYQAQLELDNDNESARLGAGRASMAINYTQARRYLRDVDPQSEETRTLLAQLDRVESLDPFAPKIEGTARAQRTMEVFRIATERLGHCSTASRPSPAAGLQPKSELRRWADQLAPMMNERKLRGRDDIIESALRFAFQTELTAEKDCGQATPDDEALLLLARERMGVVQ
jgi:hypothetical protein